ncbi:MAG: septation protein A [Pseudomonadota bacterium]|nr:septation protein A [Pseudomonadota bacterium]
MNPYTRLLVEAGPLVAFFIANSRLGLIPGTVVLMVAMALAVGISWGLERRLPVMPLVGCAFVLVFGGLTVWLEDETFIKLKPTVVNLLFATVLLAGLVFRRNLLRLALGGILQLRDEGWNRLALRWAGFFLVLAGLNELAWRLFSTDTWVAFKTFGIMPLTMAFALAQTPLVLKYQIRTE